MVDIAPGRILVVDNDESARFMRAQLLRGAGHTVFEASTLVQATELLRQCRPELVVLDVDLPDGNGLDFCREIKANDELGTVMVLQISASFMIDEGHIRGLEAGADAYLTDPTSPGVVAATANALLRLCRAERALTEMLALEQQAREDAETANRLKDDFLATLSHELRTPLNAIVGWSTLMRTTKMDDAARRHAIEIIERNAKAQAALIEDLLDISRIAQGKLDLTWHAVQIPDHRCHSGDTIRPSARSQGTHARSVPHARPDGDGSRRSGSAPTGRLESARERRQVHAGGRAHRDRKEHDDTHVLVRVTDTGRGIDPSFLPSVFDGFRRAETGTTRSEGGLGLGLSIARQLVEMHGGTLTAESPGEQQGATFVIRLPRLAPSAGGLRIDVR